MTAFDIVVPLALLAFGLISWALMKRSADRIDRQRADKTPAE